MYIIWAAAIIGFAVFEAVTTQLVSIWFVIGSVAGLISAIFGAPIWLQVTIFAIVSIIALIITRPLVKKYIHPKAEKMNADRCIGQKGVVVEEINNLTPTGLVKADGKVWTARSSEGSVIPKDSIVLIEKIEGVKVIVTPEK